MKNTNNTLFIIILLNVFVCNGQYTNEERTLLKEAKANNRLEIVRDSIKQSHKLDNHVVELENRFIYSKNKTVLQNVFNVTGAKEELYKKAKKGIISRNADPNFSIVADVENDVLKYKSGIYPFHFKGVLVSTKYNLDYVTTIEFKDNKVRLSYDLFIDSYIDGQYANTLPINKFDHNVYKRNGKYRNTMDDFVSKINSFLNKHSSLIIRSLNVNDDW